MMNFYLELGQLWRAWWSGASSVTFAGETWGIAICRPPECCEVFPSMDSAPGLVEDGPLSLGSRWMYDCSTSPDAGWCTSIVFTGTCFPIRRFGKGSFPDCCHLSPMLWLLRGYRICTYRFRSRVLFRGRYRRTAYRPVCLPGGCVTFDSEVTVLGDDPVVSDSPDIQMHAPVFPDVAGDEEADSMEAARDVPVPVLRPPPGFAAFSWPRAEWGTDGAASQFDFSRGMFIFVYALFGSQLCISEYDIPSCGLCVTVGRIWGSNAPSPIFGVDRRPGVRGPVGNGSGTVAAFVISGPSYGCGYTASSGCLFDGDESEYTGSIYPLPAGHSVQDSEAWPGFQQFSFSGSG